MSAVEERWSVEQLSLAISDKGTRLAALENDRVRGERVDSPADKTSLEIRIVRMRGELAELQGELAGRVRERDEQRAAERARLAAEKEAARPGLEAEQERLAGELVAHLETIEAALPGLRAAADAASQTDRQLRRIEEQLGFPKRWLVSDTLMERVLWALFRVPGGGGREPLRYRPRKGLGAEASAAVTAEPEPAGGGSESSACAENSGPQGSPSTRKKAREASRG